MNSTHSVDGQRGDVVDIAPHDPLETVAEADHANVLQTASDCCCADDAVDARGRPAGDEDGKFVAVMGHRLGVRRSALARRDEEASRESSTEEKRHQTGYPVRKIRPT